MTVASRVEEVPASFVSGLICRVRNIKKIKKNTAITELYTSVPKKGAGTSTLIYGQMGWVPTTGQ